MIVLIHKKHDHTYARIHTYTIQRARKRMIHADSHIHIRCFATTQSRVIDSKQCVSKLLFLMLLLVLMVMLLLLLNDVFLLTI